MVTSGQIVDTLKVELIGFAHDWVWDVRKERGRWTLRFLV